jgi:hypothetical protein
MPLPAKRTQGLLVLIGALLVSIQFIGSSPGNPPLEGPLTAPPEVEAVLARACFDCHSSRTHWPWYSRIAPVSWMVAHDVSLGREEINFSQWGAYLPGTRERKLKWMARALTEEQMPPWQYQIIHPGSLLSQRDLKKLRNWIDCELKRPPPDSKSGTGD